MARLRFDIAKCRARKPRAVEKALEDRGHADPPYGVENDEVIAVAHELTKPRKIRLELLPLAIPFV